MAKLINQIGFVMSRDVTGVESVLKGVGIADGSDLAVIFNIR